MCYPYDNDKTSNNSPYNHYTKENESSYSDNETYFDEEPRHKHGKPVNFLIVYIIIIKQTVKGHMLILQMLELNIILTMMT